MKYTLDFKPKLFSALRNYNRQKFRADLMSGIIVGIAAAFPMAIAFGIANGVTPEKGLITGIIGGFIVSLLGGCSVQIGGPTGSFIVIITGIIATYGVEGLTIATAMAGVMLVLLGVLKLGIVIKFIPYPIIVGFTAGIALTIFSTQITDFFGLTIAETIPGDFIPKWEVYFRNFHTTNLWAMGTGIVSLLIIIFVPKIYSKIPGSLAAIIIITLGAYLLNHFCGITEIETIGDRYAITSKLPSPQGFVLNMEVIQNLLPPAFTIAMLGAIESSMTAAVADGVTGDKHNTNTELIAQGAANIIVPFFGGIPVTGALARTMTNINNGGRTPVAGIINSVVLLLIMLFMLPLIKYIPMACLAGVLVMVSYHMSGWRTAKNLLKSHKTDVAVLIATFLLTVIFGLTIAITAGLMMAILLFIRRVMENTNISVISNQIVPDINPDNDQSEGEIKVIKGVEVYEIDGPFFFGIANKFEDVMREVGDKSKIRIIRMRRVPFIDSTGLYNLKTLIESSHKEGIAVILSGVNQSVKDSLINAGINKLIGEENVCDNIEAAAQRAETIMASLKTK